MESGDTGIGEKQFGINKIFRFARKKTGKMYIATKKELVKVEKKEHATVVKMEFTNTNCFILLSDGRVFSKGREEGLGRPSNSTEGNSKTFEEVLFVNQNHKENNNEEIEPEKSTTIYNISAGDEHVLALDFNYNVWAWGNNKYFQIHPKINVEVVKRPLKLTLPSSAKVAQIFAIQRSSMIIGKNNLILMWGSISEGYLGEIKEKGDHFAKDFMPMDKISSYILNDVKKNDENFTEVFINSRKLFNTKYNQTLEDNSNKQTRIEKLQIQIQNLKIDIEARQKITQNKVNSLNSISQDKSDKKILLLNDLLKSFEFKLNKISIKKDNLRKELINIEEEINQKNIDLGGSQEQIDSVEDKMETYNNEITELKSTLTESDENKNTEIYKKVAEKNKMLYNLKIYKESLMNNLQVIIVYLEEKEKERKIIADKISSQTDKENQYLKSRYTVEDMIMIVLESLQNISFSINSNNQNSVGKSNNATDKFKEKYMELFIFSNKLEKITFAELHKTFPYKIIEDLLIYSNNELKTISKGLEITKSTLSEMVKDQLKIIFDMVETKIELIKEQNAMVKHLYHIFTNLEKEIKTRHQGNRNLHDDKKINDGNDINNHVEYIYKDMIIRFFEDAYQGGKGRPKPMSTEEKERLQNEQNIYIKEKQVFIKKLEERNKMYEEVETNFNLDNVVSFNHENKKEVKSGSMFSWMGI